MFIDLFHLFSLSYSCLPPFLYLIDKCCLTQVLIIPMSIPTTVPTTTLFLTNKNNGVQPSVSGPPPPPPPPSAPCAAVCLLLLLLLLLVVAGPEGNKLFSLASRAGRLALRNFTRLSVSAHNFLKKGSTTSAQDPLQSWWTSMTFIDFGGGGRV